MALTEPQQSRIRHFLGYPSFSSLSQSIQLGYPAASQPLFLLEDAFRRLKPGGEAAVLQDLCECESIEKQMSQARTRFSALKLDKLEVNQQETQQLLGALRYWSARLADDLGVVANPYSQAEWLGTSLSGGVNSRVVG